MIATDAIRQLHERVRALQAPVLSLYAHVNPAVTDNHPHAIALRARETLRALGVPRSIESQVSRRLRAQVQQARTLVVFAHDGALETIGLQVDLPPGDARSGHLEARWGEPWVTPLVLAMDEYARAGVFFVDRDHWRIFEVFLGEIAEVERSTRPPSPAERDTLNRAPAQSPSWLPNRSGPARDNAEWHLQELARRFHGQGIARLGEIVTAHRLARLVVLGPTDAVAAAEAGMPAGLRARVVARLPSLSTPEASAAEVLERVAPELLRAERAAEAALLDRIAEEGHVGVERCVRELQLGQLHTVAFPWDSGVPVVRDPVTGLFVPGRDDAEPPTLLRDVLPGLVAAAGARLELLQGDGSQRLWRDLGGMGALSRWESPA